MTREHRQPGPVALALTATVLLGAFAILWILGTAPSGGPDEPAHLVRGAALVRGDLDGEKIDGEYGYEVPAWVGHPSASCFQLVGAQPANCATDLERPTGDAFLESAANNYPIWGHVLPGLATFAPAEIGNQLARVLDAAVPIALFVAGLALVARRGRLAVGAAALAITPMAWFSVIVVNPSGLAIAGGFALWAGLLSADRLMVGHPDRLAAWSIAAGWAATVLPRRDSLIWAALIVAIAAVAGVVDLGRLWKNLGIGPLVLVVGTTIAAVFWAATSDAASSKALVLAPLLPVAAVVIRRVWRSHPARGVHVAIGATLVAGLAVVGLVVVATRSGGFDDVLIERVLSQTGLNLVESVGLLGWLDIPLPLVALLAWWTAAGVLVGVALIRADRRALLVAAATVGIGIVSSWILELGQDSTTGTYWQGRYFLPLLIGVPLLLVWNFEKPDSDRLVTRAVDVVPRDRSRSIGNTVLATSLIVLTVAFAASMRRWGVGTEGSHRPWAWDTYGTVVPPWLLLFAHALVAGATFGFVTRFVGASDAVEPFAATDSAERVVTDAH